MGQNPQKVKKILFQNTGLSILMYSFLDGPKLKKILKELHFPEGEWRISLLKKCIVEKKLLSMIYRENNVFIVENIT